MGALENNTGTRPAAKELVWATACLVLAMGLQVWISGAVALLSRKFWLDEILTHTLVGDPDLGHALRALAGGVETHPPTFYLLLRGFTTLAGGANETTLRLFALLSTAIALMGIYRILRGHYQPPPALAATLAVGGNPVVLTYAFEARSYATWLAAVVWFTFFLAECVRFPDRWLPRSLLALSAVLVCTLHYLGILAFLLVAGGVLAARRGCLPRAAWIAAALGPLALAGFLPLLVAQRSSLPASSWMRRPDLIAATAFLLQFLDLGVILALAAASQLSARGSRRPPRPVPPDVPGLVALGFLPFLLLIFSWAVQPALMARYALPALAAMGPAVAAVLARFPRAWSVAACICLVVAGAFKLSGEVGAGRETDRQADALIDAVRQRTDGAPVVFELSDPLYVVSRYAPDMANRCFYLDFGPGEVGYANSGPAFGVGLARRYERFYGRPSGMDRAKFLTLPRKFLVLDYVARPDVSGQDLYPGRVLRHVDAGLYNLASIRYAQPPVGGPWGTWDP